MNCSRVSSRHTAPILHAPLKLHLRHKVNVLAFWTFLRWCSGRSSRPYFHASRTHRDVSTTRNPQGSPQRRFNKQQKGLPNQSNVQFYCPTVSDQVTLYIYRQ
eukprot:38669-Amphidinium_carterae.1